MSGNFVIESPFGCAVVTRYEGDRLVIYWDVQPYPFVLERRQAFGA